LKTVQDIYKNYPCKKKKFSEEINENDLQFYREVETLSQLQKDLKNLKLKSNILPLQNYEIEKPDLRIKNFICDCEMPEINDIPIENQNYVRTEQNFYYEKSKIFNSYQEEDTNDSSDTNSNFDHEISILTSRTKLKEKLIDNAIKTEKTLNKIFNDLNPQLQPNCK